MEGRHKPGILSEKHSEYLQFKKAHSQSLYPVHLRYVLWKKWLVILAYIDFIIV